MDQRSTPAPTVAPLRVVLVDDHTLVRQGLRQSLRECGVDVVGEASNGRAGAQLSSELRPDVTVMDLHMPVLDGIEATRAILAADPAARVLMLTISTEEEDVVAALAAGAAGYVLKDAPVEEVIGAIHATRTGDSVIAPRVAARLVDRLRREHDAGRRVPAPPPPDTLTERELEILRLVAQGKDNASIAQELFISPSTAKNHVASMLDKLGLANRVQAAVYAVRAGVV